MFTNRMVAAEPVDPPPKIVIWVSKEAYLIDQGIDREPRWVRDLNKLRNIIEFRWTANTGPYRKLFPALDAATDDQIIVYADDDAIYREKLAQPADQQIPGAQ
ncbi:hypothetical protein ACFS3C_15390 [Azotobacter vinelandii]